MTQLIHVGIVDDEPAAVEHLRSHLARYEREHAVRFTVDVWRDGADLAEAYTPDLDVLFLDIEMPGMDGLETARRVRAVDDEVVLVFVTNMAQYAVKGYEVDALSYLLKPVSYVAFGQELRRSIDRVRRAAHEALVLPLPGGLARVSLRDVLYLESIRHRIIVHAVDREHVLTGTLKSFEADLEGKGFFRSNHCYLVNLRHVVGIDGSAALLQGGERLQISRPRRRGLLEALAQHVGRR